MSLRKVIISGGGTGGHIFPAIAIANALKQMIEGIDILFVGAIGKMEMEKVPAAGYKIEGLHISGLQRKLTLRNLAFPFKVMRSLLAAGRILKRFQPDVVVGVGGYASGPLLYMATNKHIPALIQEQNSYAGITNRLLAKKVDRICVAYDRMDRYFPKEKLLLTGNPVRQDITDLTSKREQAIAHFGFHPQQKILLVIGGSLGSATINKSILAALPALTEAGIQVLWQTGAYYHDSMLEKAKPFLQKGVSVNAFVKEMDLAYACADLVVSRAGASSISELCLAAKPTILIPSPNVAEDHQTRNAMSLVDKQATVLVKDSEAPVKLGGEILSLMKDDDHRQQLARAIGNMAERDSAKRIADEVIRIYESRKRS
ncbi:MAG: undecaprenyldiphospho-muramoylpentapeptide beta-N-acetylglucosaminyltransferase [Flavobacteriales bacterium]|nr:undecaprenyldiphospho-muramoylpentapeptide beta-N-acetylglucosaminyltransferase [Flavobacteriales bacterium]MCB9449369.1 undecaprenyldiphospho-muramoylpentapeptide beta-N-acetylglucosaminyltransferase [Flavobacteriales bacterium]